MVPDAITWREEFDHPITGRLFFVLMFVTKIKKSINFLALTLEKTSRSMSSNFY